MNTFAYVSMYDGIHVTVRFPWGDMKGWARTNSGYFLRFCPEKLNSFEGESTKNVHYIPSAKFPIITWHMTIYDDNKIVTHLESICIPLTLNFISGHELYDTCKPCKLGYYGIGGLTACTQCSAGKTTLYTGEDDVTDCIPQLEVSNYPGKLRLCLL